MGIERHDEIRGLSGSSHYFDRDAVCAVAPGGGGVSEADVCGGFGDARAEYPAGDDAAGDKYAAAAEYGSGVVLWAVNHRTRERTVADIVIQTDHVNSDDNLTELTDASQIPGPNGKIWNSFMNYKFLPELAGKYQLGLIDQRNHWKTYLQENKAIGSEVCIELRACGDSTGRLGRGDADWGGAGVSTGNVGEVIGWNSGEVF